MLWRVNLSTGWPRLKLLEPGRRMDRTGKDAVDHLQDMPVLLFFASPARMHGLDLSWLMSQDGHVILDPRLGTRCEIVRSGQGKVGRGGDRVGGWRRGRWTVEAATSLRFKMPLERDRLTARSAEWGVMYSIARVGKDWRRSGVDLRKQNTDHILLHVSPDIASLVV